MTMFFAEDSSPTFHPAFFDCAEAMFRSLPKYKAAFKTGLGVDWHEHHPSLFKGTESFFRPGYAAHLVHEWIPLLDGVHAKLDASGARVADVGCGYGASTILMAQAIRTRASSASIITGRPIYLICAQCGGGSGRGGSRHVLRLPARHGRPGERGFACAAIVEEGRFVDDRRAVCERSSGRQSQCDRAHVFIRHRQCICCGGASLAQEGKMALGAQAGEARLKDVVTKGGFTRFRRATQTPFNLVFHAQA